jgi:hypothetical protein
MSNYKYDTQLSLFNCFFFNKAGIKCKLWVLRRFEYLSISMYIEVLVLFSAENSVFMYVLKERILKTNECWRTVLRCFAGDPIRTGEFIGWILWEENPKIKYCFKIWKENVCINNLWGVLSIATVFFSEWFYYCFIPTTCFSPYGPTSGGIYTCKFLGAIYATKYATQWRHHRPHHHCLQLPRLSTPVAMSASPHASTPKQHSPQWGDVFLRAAKPSSL